MTFRNLMLREKLGILIKKIACFILDKFGVHGEELWAESTFAHLTELQKRYLLNLELTLGDAYVLFCSCYFISIF